MLKPIFKFTGNPTGFQYERCRWTRLYACYLVVGLEEKYLGCIFRDVKSNPEPFYVMTQDHHQPYVYYKTRGAAAAHLLFEDLWKKNHHDLKTSFQKRLKC